MRLSQEKAEAGQAVYTPRTLGLYDLLVLGVSNRLIWKCPTPRLLQLYDDNVSSHHLDVGVGTGYYLHRCRFPTDRPSITLLDMNRHCLHAAAARISRYSPVCRAANILEPIDFGDTRFASIGLNYVLHCLPGSMREKLVAVEHLARLLAPGGVLFGATLLSGGVRRGWPAQRLMDFYNRRQIFSNQADDLATLEQGLGKLFDAYDIQVVGCAALLRGWREG